MHCISQNGQLKACMCKLLKICTCVQLCSEYNILKNCLFWKWQWIKHSWLYWVWHSHLIGMSQEKGCLNTMNRIHCTYVIVNFVVRFRLDFPQRYIKPVNWTPFSCYSSCCWNFLIKLLFFNTKQVTTKLKKQIYNTDDILSDIFRFRTRKYEKTTKFRHISWSGRSHKSTNDVLWQNVSKIIHSEKEEILNNLVRKM